MPETSLHGIHFMLPTPFKESGEPDLDSFKGLVDCAAQAGCTGVVCLGVMGEAHRLNDAERRDVLGAVTRAAGERLTVTVGVSSDSYHLVAERAREA